MTIFLRFAFGVILAGGLVVMRVGMPLLVEVIFIVGVGIIAAIWGDKFILGFMSMMRYLR
ncbi:MAG TPA: hypothetical protein VGQ39_06245 [Pyrinomonadaceae bacterium]|jgi:hypothetical protein|nr:hypothetical protein [Pyrinomonadaceae bacterium]